MSNARITVRLPADLLEKLDRWPGENRAARVRGMLASQSVGAAIAGATADSVGREIAPAVAALRGLDNRLDVLTRKLDGYTKEAAQASKNGETVGAIASATINKHIDEKLDALARALGEEFGRLQRTGVRK